MLKSRLLLWAILALAGGWLHSAPAAQTRAIGEQLFRLEAADAQAEDNLGISVAISGEHALVGAHLDDDAGLSSGAAYLFDVSSGVQRFKLSALDAAPGDQFGIAVAISGSVAIIGARLDDEAGANAGAAYLFDAVTGQQRFKLIAADGQASDDFGLAVAISGNAAIVGAQMEDDGGANAGAAYLFEVSTGVQRFKLTAADPEPFARFGVSVAISGKTAIVGALGDSEGGPNAGAAYLFDVETGEQLRKLTAADADSAEYFGHAVAISNERAVVGAYWDDDAGFRAGSAYFFDTSDGAQLFDVTAADAQPGDLLGFSVGIDGNTAIVGAHHGGDAGYAAGAAYLFDIGTGIQLARLTAADAAEDDNLAYAVAISGDRALAGAPGADGIYSAAGAAYLFDAAAPGTAVAQGPGMLAPLVLRGAAPSPFHAETRLSFDLAAAAAVALEIFAVDGRRVRTLTRGRLPAGSHAQTWDGRDDAGRALSAGVYLARLRSERSAATQRLILLR